jgi:hypothetical protein
MVAMMNTTVEKDIHVEAKETPSSSVTLSPLAEIIALICHPRFSMVLFSFVTVPTSCFSLSLILVQPLIEVDF